MGYQLKLSLNTTVHSAFVTTLYIKHISCSVLTIPFLTTNYHNLDQNLNLQDKFLRLRVRCFVKHFDDGVAI